MIKSWRAYWLEVSLVALGLFAWSFWNGSFGVPTCIDGHCPDVRSLEYEGALVERRHNALPTALVVAAFWLMLSLGGAGIVLAMKRALRMVRRPAE